MIVYYSWLDLVAGYSFLQCFYTVGWVTGRASYAIYSKIYFSEQIKRRKSHGNFLAVVC